MAVKADWVTGNQVTATHMNDVAVVVNADQAKLAGVAAGASALSVDGTPVSTYDLDTTPPTASDVGAYTTAQTDTAITTAVTQRVTTLASASTLTPNCDTTDVVLVPALATSATIAAPTGTPVSGQRLRFSITDDSSNRILTWNAAYVFRRPILPPLNTVGLAVYVDFVWNAATAKWDCIATNSGKRAPRNVSLTSTSTLNANADTHDFYEITALAVPMTIGALAGSPGPAQTFMFRFKDDGTGRALTWNAVFIPIGVTLPTTTVAGKWMYINCIYNNTTSQWHAIDVKTQA